MTSSTTGEGSGLALVGRFPFGARAGRCLPRRVDDAELFVLGVYPSAFHVRWTRPDEKSVRALAVAPEPYPFWRGENEQELFDDIQSSWNASHGTIGLAGGLNGSSGRSVADHVVEPMGVSWERVWLTDALPYFHVHQGRGSQGAAMRHVYDPWAGSAGLDTHRLPSRPAPSALIRHAVTHERDRLRQELLDSNTTTVITLGNEALAVIASVVDRHDLPEKLVPTAGYGVPQTADLASRRLDVVPLVHPGQRVRLWRDTHASWNERQAQRRA